MTMVWCCIVEYMPGRMQWHATLENSTPADGVGVLLMQALNDQSYHP